MEDDVYDTFKPTSVKPTVREYKVIIITLSKIIGKLSVFTN